MAALTSAVARGELAPAGAAELSCVIEAVIPEAQVAGHSSQAPCRTTSAAQSRRSRVLQEMKFNLAF
jgi:hypothetical protein